VCVGVLVLAQQRSRGEQPWNAEQQRGDREVRERRDVECGGERAEPGAREPAE
jgi:hypothetical protein